MSAGRGRHLRFDILLTFATEFLILGASFAVLRLAAHRWGPVGFGDYVLARRSFGWVQLPVLTGMHLALARYIAMAGVEEDRASEAAYLRAGLLVLLGSITLMTACFLAAAGPLAFLFLGASSAGATMRVLVLPTAGIVLHSATYGALRGQRMTRAANLLQGINLGVVPLVALSIPAVTVRAFLAVVGCAWLVLSGCAVVCLRLVSARVPLHWRMLRACMVKLLRYGLPRVPGEVALGGLFTLPATFAAHYAGSVEAGRIGLGLSVLQLVGALFAPLGQVLLPAISAQLASGETAALRRRVTRLAIGGVLLAVVVVVGVEWSAPWLLRVFFGAAFAPAVPVVRIMALAGVPYAAYILLRSVLDAVHHEPMNARNLVYGVVAFLAVAVLIDAPVAVPIAVVTAMVVLGGRTLYDIRRSVFRTSPFVAGPDAGAFSAGRA